MTDERNFVKEYNEWLNARVAAGMPAIERSMVTLGQSFVWMSPEGIKTIEWSDMQDPASWKPNNETTT